MTKEEVFFLIDSRIKELELPYLKVKEFDRLKECLTNNPYSNNDEIFNIDIFEVVACILYSIIEKNAEEENHDVNYYYSLFSNTKNYLNSTSYINTIVFYDTMLDLITVDADKLIDFSKQNITNVLNNKDLEKESKEVQELHTKAYEEIVNLFQVLDIEKKYINYLLKGIGEYLITKTGIWNLKENNTIPETLNFREFKRLYKSQMNFHIKKMLNLENGLELIKTLEKYVYHVLENEKKYDRQRKKEISFLINIQDVLNEELKHDEIKDIQSLISGIKTEEIKRGVLLLIYEHNMKYYQRLEDQLLLLQDNEETKYYALLKKYGISITKDNLQKIVRNSVSDVKEILKLISSYKFSESSYITILENTNIKIVSIITELVNKGFINIDFLKENIDIYYDSSKKLERCLFNLEIINKYKINPMIFKNHNDLLLSNILYKNLEILDKYDYIKSIKTTFDYSFLESDNLEEKIDKLIELGLSKYLEDNISILNYDNINRLELLKAMGYDVAETEVEKYLQSNFFVKDEVIDSYISDLAKITEEKEFSIDIESLDNYKIDPRTYSINGILVSVNKVLRKIEEGYSIYSAIVYQKRMNMEEYNKLISEIINVKIKNY
ncbi:MAG: hypothetical protein IJ068_04915 [Bacilli bacterium]|nr:hypothetical protein [Bacilli bacterium]